MDKIKCQEILQKYFDLINDRDFENYLTLLLDDFKEKIIYNDLNFVFGLKKESQTEFVQFELISLSDSTSHRDYEVFKMDYSFTLKEENNKIINTDTFVYLFYNSEDESITFLPYLPEKRELIFSLLPITLVNEILKNEEKPYTVDLIPYPEFENVFAKETDPKAKFVFLPLVTIKITDHELLKNKTFHLISIWDTGDYEKEYFGDYRIDVNEIQFDLIDNKLGYKDKINFPKIEFLEDAYKIIIEDFEIQKDNYLNDLSSENKKSKIERGQNLILNQIPEFGNFEAKYYFERITSALLSKYRYQKYGVVNSCFNDNSFLKNLFAKELYSEEEYDEIDFNKTGKIHFVDNLLLRPDFVQGNEFPPNTTFIGQVDVGEFISFDSTNMFLFYDDINEKQVQIFQWD